MTHFKQHKLGKGTEDIQIIDYASGDLRLADLSGAQPVPSHWLRSIYNADGRQVKGEASLFYRPSTSFDLVTGFEARSGLLQGDYTFNLDCPNPRPALTLLLVGESLTADADPTWWDYRRDHIWKYQDNS